MSEDIDMKKCTECNQNFLAVNCNKCKASFTDKNTNVKIYRCGLCQTDIVNSEVKLE